MSKFKVPSTFTIPDTAVGVLGLFKARGWERAAVVYACTTPKQGVTSTSTNNRGSDEWLRELQFPCSYEDFAALGISGLRDPQTVAKYRDRWADAMRKRKAKAVKPGDTIDVPDLKWPPTGHSHGKADALSPQGTLEQKVALARELLDDPAVETEVYREPERVDRAVTVDAQHAARNRRIVDQHVEPEDEPTSVSYRREQDEHGFLDALAHTTELAIMLNQIANDLAGIELTDVQKDQLERRYERVAAKLEMLRASTSAGSIDDELAAMLSQGE